MKPFVWHGKRSSHSDPRLIVGSKNFETSCEQRSPRPLTITPL
jgi:hypothetical protein